MKTLYKNYQILNNKQVKEFHKKLKEQFDFSDKLDYLFFQKKEKIYIVSKSLLKLPIENIRMNSLGLYIAKKEINGIRLSIEGSQLIGPKSKKNILNLINPDPWLKGETIEVNKKLGPIVIIKSKKDYLGSGIYKDGKILNFIPKSRRIK